MASIRCGNCGNTHSSVQEVRECYAALRVLVDKEPTVQPVQPVEVPPVPPRIPGGEGWYFKDGKVYKIQQSLSSGHLYAKVLNGSHWDYAAGVVKNLYEDQRLTAAEAAEYGKLYGVCCVCGRVLTNEQSISEGIGPICSGRIAS